MRVHRWVSLSESVVLEHVEKSRFTSIIKSKEDDVSIFLEESGPLEDAFKEVYNEHFFLSQIYL